MKYAFPAIFEQDKNGIAVYFPDDESIVTCGDNLEEAIFMAEDVLNLALWDREEDNEDIPTPSKIEDIKLAPNQMIKMIYADTEAYAKQVAEKNDNLLTNNYSNDWNINLNV